MDWHFIAQLGYIFCDRKGILFAFFIIIFKMRILKSFSMSFVCQTKVKVGKQKLNSTK